MVSARICLFGGCPKGTLGVTWDPQLLTAGQQPSAGGPSSSYAQSSTSHHSHSPTQTHSIPGLAHSSSNPSLAAVGNNMPNLAPDLLQSSHGHPHNQPTAMDLDQLGHMGGLAQPDSLGQTQRVPDDIWLSAPAPLNDTLGGFGGIQGMQGIDSGHGNSLGGSGNGTDNVGGIDTSRLWGESRSGNEGDIFCESARALQLAAYHLSRAR